MVQEPGCELGRITHRTEIWVSDLTSLCLSFFIYKMGINTCQEIHQVVGKLRGTGPCC